LVDNENNEESIEMEISDSEFNELAVSPPQTTSPPIQPQMSIPVAAAHSASISSESNNSDTNNNSTLARKIANPIGSVLTDEVQRVIDAEADNNEDVEYEDDEGLEATENVEDDENSGYCK
jgi:hypothetical protein